MSFFIYVGCMVAGLLAIWAIILILAIGDKKSKPKNEKNTKS